MNENKLLTISQELELLSSLEAHGEVPLKFNYLGNGYENWLRIAIMSRDSGGVELIEKNLLKSKLPFIFEEIKERNLTKFNIVDLGCGDGKPIETIFEYLKENNYLEDYDVTYIPIDISQNMLDIAANYISKKFNIKIKPALVDFEKGSFPEILINSNNEKSFNYCFFLGNTLGNFSDTGRLLSNFKDSLFSTDYLIIGNELSNLQSVKKIVKYYENDLGYNMAINVLKYYGYKDEDGEYKVKWNERKKQIEGYVILKKDIKFVIANVKVKFEKDEEILLFISKKYVEEDLIKIFNEIGFRIHLFTTNREKRHCILSINPSRYKTN